MRNDNVQVNGGIVSIICTVMEIGVNYRLYGELKMQSPIQQNRVGQRTTSGQVE
jgi:hypothetical protein